MEYSATTKEQVINLEDSFFNSVPESNLDNLKDFPHFEDFTRSDLQIQGLRKLKYKVLCDEAESFVSECLYDLKKKKKATK